MAWRVPAVHIHAPTGERMATLRTAHQIQPIFKRMDPATCQVTVSRNDPQLNLDVLTLGNRLVVESPHSPPWVGPILLPQENSDGSLTLGAVGLSAMLDGRTMPNGMTYSAPTGSGSIVADVITTANREGWTGINIPSIVPAGPSIQDLQLGGQSALAALNQLYDRTYWEWWTECQVTPSQIRAVLKWGRLQGEDYSGLVHLYPREHYKEIDYALDWSQLKSSITVAGGLETLADRQTMIQAVGTGKNVNAVIVDERLRRATLAYGAPLTSRVILDPTTTNPSELSRRGRADQERNLTQAETFPTIAVNTKADWDRITLGNYITVHARTTLGGDIARVVRVAGYQPDYEAGLLYLTPEIAVL